MASVVAWIRVNQKRRLRVVSLDVDHCPELAERLGVTQVPALILCKDGVIVETVEGRATARQIERLIEPHVG